MGEKAAIKSLFHFFYRNRAAVVHASTAFSISSACVLAFHLRFQELNSVWQDSRLPQYLFLALLIKLSVYFLFRIERGSWRKFGFGDFLNIFTAVLTAQTILWFTIFILNVPYSRRVFFIDGLLSLVFLAGLRGGTRHLYETLKRSRQQYSTPEGRLLILGAGDGATSFVRHAKRNRRLPFEIIGYLDDSRFRQSSKFIGVPVLGRISEIHSVVAKNNITSLLIAIPSLREERLREIVNICLDTKLPIKILPSIKDIVEHGFDVMKPRELRVEDLLGRRSIQLDKTKTISQLEGSVVCVTGAGGSIGSELCRQIASFSPKELILFDRYENGLFYVDGELRKKFPHLNLKTLVGDMTNLTSVRRLFESSKIDFVYHAAAHKHVPLMEANPHEAVHNNLQGTLNLAQESVASGVKRFIMVSTDKAVNPKNVMGYTKRLAELIGQSFSGQATSFVSVRFGNVLASNGSVIEIFSKQIAAGGPVTVTHPEAVRYFMTIPEAVELILQAGSHGEEGQVYLLEMGAPVSITQLAQKMIRLSDPTGVQNIKIEFSGLRPGEKIFEELIADGEHVIPSSIEKVFVLKRKPITSNIEAEIKDLIQSQHLDNAQLIIKLRKTLEKIERPTRNLSKPEIHSRQVDKMATF